MTALGIMLDNNIEQETVRRFVDGRPESFKVGDAALVLDNDLAVDQRRLTGQLGGGIDHRRYGPVQSLPGRE
jgi:hypothetical protein